MPEATGSPPRQKSIDASSQLAILNGDGMWIYVSLQYFYARQQLKQMPCTSINPSGAGPYQGFSLSYNATSFMFPVYYVRFGFSKTIVDWRRIPVAGLSFGVQVFLYNSRRHLQGDKLYPFLTITLPISGNYYHIHTVKSCVVMPTAIIIEGKKKGTITRHM